MGLTRKRDEHARARTRAQLLRPPGARKGDWKRDFNKALLEKLPVPTTTSRPTLAEAGKQALARLEPQLREHKEAYVAVDVDSDRWIVAKTVTELLKQVRAQMPGCRVYLSRVDKPYVFQLRAR